MSKFDQICLAAIVTSATLFATGPAIAQTSQPDRLPNEQSEQSKSSDSPRGILAGPQIDEKKVSDVPFLTDERRGTMSPAGTRIPIRAWMRILSTLELGDEQRTEVRKIQMAFLREQRAFEEENADLIRQARGLRRRGGDLTQEQVELRRKAQQVMRTAPSPEKSLEQIWELLDESQQEQLSTALDEYRKRRGQRGNRDRRQVDDSNPDSELDERNEESSMATDDGETSAESTRLRRLRFLRNHQSSTAQGSAPAPDDLDFEFDDTDQVDDGGE